MVGEIERNERYPYEETKTASPRHSLDDCRPCECSVRPCTSRLQPGLHLRLALLHHQQPRDLRSELAALSVATPPGRSTVDAPTRSSQLPTPRSLVPAGTPPPGTVTLNGGGNREKERNSHEETTTAPPRPAPDPYGPCERSVRPCTSLLQPGLHHRRSLLHH